MQQGPDWLMVMTNPWQGPKNCRDSGQNKVCDGPDVYTHHERCVTALDSLQLMHFMLHST